MNYDERKLEYAMYIETQSKLLPSQKILKRLFSILSDSRRYIDYCSELKDMPTNNVELLLLAEFFFLDCSVVFFEYSILKLSILLDNDPISISLENFFNVLNGADVKKFESNSLFINSSIKIDRKELQQIRLDFINYKNKRDKGIAHFDKSNIEKDNIIYLDMDKLIEIQTRTFGLIEKYFELLDLPKPASLMDYASLGLLSGLDTIKNLVTRSLTELDFLDNEDNKTIIRIREFAKEFKKISR